MVQPVKASCHGHVVDFLDKGDCEGGLPDVMRPTWRGKIRDRELTTLQLKSVRQGEVGDIRPQRYEHMEQGFGG